ncbi:hypothetical protein HF847_11085 [Clostridium cochlearium]|uniref:arginase family protein n=1 Tax=Clostridium cochlearium TaxID=1494 RepID=UPI0014598DD6|nr:arginase family protein [Clostridium cochlearium]NME96520.1 hypothetical protein [Clostridium cochlearium]
MGNKISILDFDNTYSIQTFYQHTDYEWVNLLDIKSASRYCEKKSLININRRLKKRKNRGITFIGNGNYHYVTYLLMREIKSPFTLVLFDNHTDMLKTFFDTLISCGSWVLKGLDELPMLKKVVILGARQDLVNVIPTCYNNIVSAFSKEKIGQGIEFNKYIKSEILTENVYISIDKDVLSESEAVTNWDQGNMKLSQLFNFIKCIFINKNICGIDVCGEYHYSPTESFCRESVKAMEKNNKANLAILNMISKFNISIL